jgi:predicted murein hydrolase (TIGR00659 family)
MVLLTATIFYLSRSVYERTRVAMLHPVLLSVGVLAALVRAGWLDGEAYRRGAAPLGFLLGPAVVALGAGLDEHAAILARRPVRRLGAVVAGAIFGALSAGLLARLGGAPRALVATLLPKSVTSPIAMGVAERLGGYPELTTLVVLCVGGLGAALGPPLLRLLGVRDPVSVGLALGASSHALGTARAGEIGPEQGAASSVGLALAGVVTALLAVPLFDLVMR